MSTCKIGLTQRGDEGYGMRSCAVLVESLLESRLYSATSLMLLLNTSRQLAGWCLKIGHDIIVPRPFRFIIHYIIPPLSAVVSNVIK